MGRIRTRFKKPNRRIIMKKMLFVTLFAACSLMQAQECKFDNYQAKLTDNYLKDCGLINITVGGKRIFQRNAVYFSYLDGDKVVQARETPTLEYQFKDNVFTSVKKMADKDGKELAEVGKTIKFEPNSIHVEIMAKALTDYKLKETWHGYSELLQMPVSELIGATLEVERHDGSKVTAIIPKEYSKETWSFRPQRDKSVKIILEQYIVNISCSENAVVGFNHYGGKDIEIAIIPDVKSYETEVKAGSEKKWDYKITFEKI